MVDLEQDPEFTALSYVCGVLPVEPCTILCDNVHFNVTSNCHSAIWHLRRKLGHFTIWVSSVCISGAPMEKSQQISLMSDIYNKAATVYAWLGEGNERTGRAMSFLAVAGLQAFSDIQLDGTREFSSTAAAWAMFASGLIPGNQLFPSKYHGMPSPFLSLSSSLTQYQ